MKIISVLFLYVFSVSGTFAQELMVPGPRNAPIGWNFGLIGGINTTWLFNKNVKDAGEHLDYSTTFGGSLGFNYFLVFSERAAISIGLIYSGHNQKHQGAWRDDQEEEIFNYENFLRLRYLDIPLLFRLQSPKGPYMEIGPQVSVLLSAKEDYTATPSQNNLNYTGRGFKENFNNINVAAILGFGVDFDPSENFIISAGMRFGYGFTDVTIKYSPSEAEALFIQNKLSYTSTISHLDSDFNYKYESTTRVFGGLALGLAYKIP